MDKTARQRPRGYRLEAIPDLAKVGVAGSNPVVRSMTSSHFNAFHVYIWWLGMDKDVKDGPHRAARA